MELVRWEPFAGFGNFRSLFNDLLDGNIEHSPAQPGLSKRYPAMDVLESKESYLIRAELPGMKMEDIKVEVKDGTLTVSGEMKKATPAEGVEYRHIERMAAKFCRSFGLPESAKQEGIEASYKDGILEIRVPKAEKAKPRKIEVTVH
jgi:HSP20 family protein